MRNVSPDNVLFVWTETLQLASHIGNLSMAKTAQRTIESLLTTYWEPSPERERLIAANRDLVTALEGRVQGLVHEKEQSSGSKTSPVRPGRSQASLVGKWSST